MTTTDTQAPRRPRGRPSVYTPEIADEICEWIADGRSLREWCRQHGKPTWSAVYAWLRADADFSARFALARDVGADAIAEDTLALLDAAPERHATQFGDKIDPAHVQWTKNRADQRLKLLAKWNPKKYGDRVDVNHGGQVSYLLEVPSEAASPEDWEGSQ